MHDKRTVLLWFTAAGAAVLTPIPATLLLLKIVSGPIIFIPFLLTGAILGAFAFKVLEKWFSAFSKPNHYPQDTANMSKNKDQ